MTPNHALFLFYLAHAACYLLVTGALMVLNRAYHRPYLRYWSFSWLALCCHRVVGALLVYPLWDLGMADPVNVLLIGTWLATAWWHSLWLGVGTYELAFDKPVPQSLTDRSAGALVAVAFTLTIATALLEYLAPRVLITLVYLPTAAVYLAVGFALFGRLAWRGSLGRVLVILGLVAFGLQRALYMAVGLRERTDLTEYFAPLIQLSQAELPIILVFGIGMIVWLIDEESATRRKTATLESHGVVVAGVAHELRNPLFAISATLDSFVASAPSTELSSYIEHIRRQVRTLAEQMDRLIEFGRPLEARLIPGSVKHVVVTAVEAVTPRAQEHDVTLEVALQRDTPQPPMDVERLTAAVTLLIENAVEHSPPGSTVRVSDGLTKQGDVALTVRDDGPGFSETALAKSTEPFYSEPSDRVGLGLSIAEHIVRAHGGSLEIRNDVAGGAVASLRLPSRESR